MATKKTVKTIRERLDGKMWKAVQAMIDGLKKQSEREDFEIDMATFGDSETDVDNGSKICVGCAATCAVQEIAKKNLTPAHILEVKRASFLKFNYDDMDEFERGINDLRMGDLYSLRQYLEIPKSTSVNLVKKLPRLETGTWKKGLPKYQLLADKLKEKDI